VNGNHINGQRKASEAKLRGNRVHNQLKILCLRWMKKHRPEAVRRLKSQAQAVIK
jgi:hypothetical protein